MMDVSLDTDIVIHLYSSRKEDLIFRSFEKVYMHEFLYTRELKVKSPKLFIQFSSDIAAGKVTIIKNTDLTQFGIRRLYDSYLKEYRDLFDQGEMHAVALAKTLGLAAFISDDTKEFGPHDLLVKESVEEVIPFAFYELLFLEYLHKNLGPENIHREFAQIVHNMSYPMDFKQRMNRTVKRFSSKFGTRRDWDWICQYCQSSGIDYLMKMRQLKRYLDQLDDQRV